MTRNQLVLHMVDVCHRLAARGNAAAGGGWVSARSPRRTVLITCTRIHKGMVTAEDSMEIGVDGRRIAGRGRSSAGAVKHLFLHDRRPNTAAVVSARPGPRHRVRPHPHSPRSLTAAGGGRRTRHAPACALCHPALRRCGRITPPPHQDGWSHLPLHHGGVSCSPSLLEAWLRMEEAEHAAAVATVTRMPAKVHPPTANRLERLQAITLRSYGKELHP